MNNNKQEGSANLVRIADYSDGDLKMYYVTEEEHRERRLKDLGQVAVFVGPRGSGKTLSMVYWAVQFLTKEHRVWSNFDIEFDF
jgi:predicted AAA+ superfamily ATPase